MGGPMPQKLKGHLEHCLFESESWTPSLDASPWPETVYHLEYRRADGSLAERIVKADLHDRTYLELLADLEHRNQHRLCEAARMKMNQRSRCVIKWGLAKVKVDVLCC